MASTGYSVFDNGSLIKYGKIPTTAKGFKSEDLRINHVVNVIENIINEYKVDKVVCEDQFTSVNPKTTLTLRKLIGAIVRMTYEHDIDITYYYPAQWRKILGINKGKAKDKKIAAYNYLFEKGIFTEKFIQSGVKKNDDIVDSICIGIAYLKENKEE